MRREPGYSNSRDRPTSRLARIAALLPGMLLCLSIAGFSFLIENAERKLISHPYVEALAIAILLGMLVRGFWTPTKRWRAGVSFSGAQLLEAAVMLLGASISFSTIAASGITLPAVIAAVVIIALCISFGVSRMLGLPTRLSILIACGNSICGNSAIAAIGPIIGANNDEIASSIAFTAILSVMMVLGLPLLIPLLHLSDAQYGVLAGLTVYAVPQVLAATAPAGLVSAQIATFVKLMRVLMLGPVVVGLSLATSRQQQEPKKATLSAFRVLPWFILGFLTLATLRSLQIIPATVVDPVARITGFITVVSMAALGLAVDLRTLANVGGRVAAAVTLSLILLIGISIALVLWLNLTVVPHSRGSQAHIHFGSEIPSKLHFSAVT